MKKNKHIPEKWLRDALESLKEKKTLQIFKYVCENGETPLLDLPKALNMSLRKIKKYIMHNLMRYALLDNWYVANSFDDQYLRYDISKLGKIIYENYFINAKNE